MRTTDDQPRQYCPGCAAAGRNPWSYEHGCVTCAQDAIRAAGRGRKGYCQSCGYAAEAGTDRCRLCRLEDDEAAADAAGELALTNREAERRRVWEAHNAAARAGRVIP